MVAAIYDAHGRLTLNYKNFIIYFLFLGTTISATCLFLISYNIIHPFTNRDERDFYIEINKQIANALVALAYAVVAPSRILNMVRLVRYHLIIRRMKRRALEMGLSGDADVDALEEMEQDRGLLARTKGPRRGSQGDKDVAGTVNDPDEIQVVAAAMPQPQQQQQLQQQTQQQQPLGRVQDSEEDGARSADTLGTLQPLLPLAGDKIQRKTLRKSSLVKSLYYNPNKAAIYPMPVMPEGDNNYRSKFRSMRSVRSIHTLVNESGTIHDSQNHVLHGTDLSGTAHLRIDTLSRRSQNPTLNDTAAGFPCSTPVTSTPIRGSLQNLLLGTPIHPSTPNSRINPSPMAVDTMDQSMTPTSTHHHSVLFSDSINTGISRDTKTIYSQYKTPRLCPTRRLSTIPEPLLTDSERDTIQFIVSKFEETYAPLKLNPPPTGTAQSISDSLEGEQDQKDNHTIMIEASKKSLKSNNRQDEKNHLDDHNQNDTSDTTTADNGTNAKTIHSAHPTLRTWYILLILLNLSVVTYVPVCIGYWQWPFSSVSTEADGEYPRGRVFCVSFIYLNFVVGIVGECFFDLLAYLVGRESATADAES